MWSLAVAGGFAEPARGGRGVSCSPFPGRPPETGLGLVLEAPSKTMKCNFVVNIRFPAGCPRSSRLLLGFGRRNPSDAMGRDKPEEALDEATLGKCPQRQRGGTREGKEVTQARCGLRGQVQTWSAMGGDAQRAWRAGAAPRRRVGAWGAPLLPPLLCGSPPASLSCGKSSPELPSWVLSAGGVEVFSASSILGASPEAF